MSRILLVSNYAWTIYNFRRNLISRLRDEAYEVCIQTEFDGYESKLGLPASAVLPLDIDRRGVNPVRDARTILSIQRAISATKCDICLFFTIKPVVYGGIAATLSARPFVSNITGAGSAFQNRAWIRLAAKTLLRLGLAKASHVFFQNDEDEQFFLRHGLVRHERTSLLPGSGVDLDRFKLSPYPEGALVFLLVARMLWEKGIGEYIEAARRIRAAHPNVQFRLLGPAGVLNPGAIPRKVIDAWVAEGIVEYLGQTDDVYPHLFGAHCIVLPSFYKEGTPRSLLEAAAVGRPIITTNVPGCRTTVTDGVTGFLCEPQNVDDIVRKMRHMMEMPTERRAEIGAGTPENGERVLRTRGTRSVRIRSAKAA